MTLLIAVYDANVLYPSTLRDVLIRIAITGLVQAKWTDQILEETFRNLKANRPDLIPERLDRTRTLMDAAIRDVLVVGYERHIDDLDLPDPGDRHVLAAAIETGADVIVTKNLRHFPASVLAAHEVDALHPDEFLEGFLETNPSTMLAVIGLISQTWAHGTGPRDVLDRLALDTPRTAETLRTAL